MIDTSFWRIKENARIDQHAADVKHELHLQARQAKDELSINVGWMIRSMAQRRWRDKVKRDG